MSLTVYVPDCHHHHHDQRAIDSVWSAIGDNRPDEVVILGDFIDAKAPARWSKGGPDEFAADLLDECAAGKKNLAGLRSLVPASTKITFIRGNHEARITSYTRREAPALVGLVPSFQTLLGFDELNIEYKQQPYVVAPGVRAIHGEKLRSTQNAAGQSAYAERQRHGTSIIQGHTHRAGLGFDTQDKTRFWMECGHLLDIKKAHYLSFSGLANWQQAFGFTWRDGSRITPGLVHVQDRGRFYWNGKAYK